MAVENSKLVSDGLYVPFRGVSRLGPVATFNMSVSVTGDGSGGSASLRMTVDGGEFGFPWMMVPLLVTALDTLTTKEDVAVSERSASERMQVNLQLRIEMGPAGFGQNVGHIAGSLPILEGPHPVLNTVNRILQWDWATNENGATYDGTLFAVVYDRQAMARQTELMLEGPIAGSL